MLGKTYVHSILAGMMIGLAGTTYLSVSNKIIGSALFSFGLITIVVRSWSLYTGKIGALKLTEKGNLPYIVTMLVGNYFGTLLIAFAVRISRIGDNLIPIATQLWQNKINDSWYSILTLSILCGIMMQLAVDGYKHHNEEHLILIAIPVMFFILCGYEHSIANIFYMNLAVFYSLKSFGYIILMITGNAIGAKFVHYLSIN